MASIVETTAVALRRGDHESNLNFRGIQGEVSVDLGTQSSGGVLGVDNETTLRLHNGITRGGIPMCRADMRNMTTQALAEERGYLGDKNLAYADLSNIEQSADSTAVNNLIDILVRYGLITQDTVQEYLQNYALKNMTNVNTSDLATDSGHFGKNLAYSDTSNINTLNLVDTILHDGTNGNKPLAYADGYNFNTTLLTTTPFAGPALAKKDLSNVSSSFWENLFINQYNVETKSNKDSVIPEGTPIAGHYPETAAVKQYVSNIIDQGIFLNKNFDNASTFEPLYSNSVNQIYTFNISQDFIEDGGTNFILNKKYPVYSLDEELILKLIVNSVDSNGIPTSISLNTEVGNQEYNISDLCIISELDTVCYFNLVSSFNANLQLYEYSVSIDTSMPNEGGFIANKEYSIFYDESSEISDLVVNDILYFIPTSIDSSGSVLEYTYIPSSTITNIESDVIEIYNANGNNARINFSESKTLPDIGGAGLLKTDLTNLRGMTAADITSETNSKWRINHNDIIPSSNTEITNTDYFSIANIGAIWDALYGNNNTLVHKNNSETITGSKTFTDYIIALGLQAYSADLAELYESDADYPVGTLIKFGGNKEITIADLNEVNGVISEKPALLLNKDCKGLPVALTGKTRIRVKGKVNKFDKLTNFYDGMAVKRLSDEHKIIAIALEDKNYEDEGLVMCVTNLSL